MSVKGGPNIVTDGLLRYLDIGNIKSYPGSGSTILDLSGSENHGTNNGATYNGMISDPKNFLFNQNDYISGTSLYNSRDEGTVEVWFQHEQSSHTQQGMIYFEGTGNGYGSEKEMHLSVSTAGAVQIFFESGATDLTVSQSGVTTENVWLCATATFTGLTSSMSGKIYINGVLSNSGNVASAYTGSSPSSNSLIGRSQTVISSAYRALTGMIASVRCYDRELTAAEVKQNYNATKAIFGL